jgi:4-amino-4-deoxy-L-arabinose transferase-like glycosyltransferase
MRPKLFHAPALAWRSSSIARVLGNVRSSARRWRSVLTVVGFLVLGVLVFGAYVRTTPFDRRTHDLQGHLEHIDYVLAHHAVPAGNACWECYQPPAYYALAAAVLATAPGTAAAHGNDAIGEPAVAGANGRLLQTLSASLAALTLLFQLLAVREMARGYAQLTASAMLTFWPTLPVEACKVGNDTLLYVFASAALWLLVRWRRGGGGVSLVLAAAAAGLAANTKLSGVVLVMAVGLAAIVAVAWRPRQTRAFPKGALPAALVLGVSLAALAFTVVSVKQGLLSNDASRIGDHQTVATTLGSFVRVSVRSFVEYPYANMMRAGTGRDQFWNYLFRTSLFGEEPPAPPRDALLLPVASALAACAAVLFAFVLAGLVRFLRLSFRRTERGARELVLVAAGLVLAIVVLRARVPLACSNDFRYVVPIVVPFALMMAAAMDTFRRRLRRQWPHLAALPGWLVVAFCGLSVQLPWGWL